LGRPRSLALIEPSIATFTLARYERRRVPGLLASVPLERLALRRVAGLAWGRHLGTASGERTVGTDLGRWAWFCAWNDANEARRFHARIERTSPAEIGTLVLRATRSRGSWRTRGLDPGDDAHRDGGSGPIAVLTRARVKAMRWSAFRSAAPAADAALMGAAGRIASVGVGEWPVLVQGTFSIWESTAAMSAFARRDRDHAEVIRRTAAEGWYAEELFARFAILDSLGTWDGRPTAG